MQIRSNRSPRSTIRAAVLLTACVPFWSGMPALAAGTATRPWRWAQSGAQPAAANPSTGERPAVDSLLAKLLASYKNNEKRYEALAEKIRIDVEKRLASSPWMPAESATPALALASHPFNVLVRDLAQQAEKLGAAEKGKPKLARPSLLADYPWLGRLELDLGLDLGSDRPIPKHHLGFIDLGDAPDPWTGFPELATNYYLFGLQRIAGWRTGVKLSKSGEPSFAGWDDKNPPQADTSLPGWEALRVYLLGSRPAVTLQALPALTHAVHARLVERRKSAAGELSRMDHALAFLDSKWNGFAFRAPFTKQPIAVVIPMHLLMSDRKGFFDRFAGSAKLASVGDLPFIAMQTVRQFEQLFPLTAANEAVPASAGVESSGDTDAFTTQCAYLTRYRMLLDLFARSILTPHLPLPEYLAYADCTKGSLQHERQVQSGWDVPRKYAVLAWAYVGKDPAKLADFLFDELLGKAPNQFPSSEHLVFQFVKLARAREADMLAVIAQRIQAERTAKGPDASQPSVFELEFSPYADYLGQDGAPTSDYLFHSFRTFHDAPSKMVRDAAHALVAKEVGD